MKAKFERLLADSPTPRELEKSDPDALKWVGEVSAAFKRVGKMEFIRFQTSSASLTSSHTGPISRALSEVQTLMYEVIAELSANDEANLDRSFEAGNPYDYFETMRSIIRLAKNSIMFVDPYIDATFVKTYLASNLTSANIQLLLSKHFDEVIVATDLLSKQNGRTYSIKKSKDLHDRFVIVDEDRCFNSGASFKDGASQKPTTIIEIVAPAHRIIAHYQSVWDSL